MDFMRIYYFYGLRNHVNMKTMESVRCIEEKKNKGTLILTITLWIMAFFFLPSVVEAQDWADLSKYKEANSILKKQGKATDRVVFMGNSITEFWSTFDSSFFAGKPYINRGISGQTTPQMLIRFRPDVIELEPSIVVILAGINDIAENNGPATVEEISGNIFSMVELARSNNIDPIMCTVLPAYDFYWRPGLNPAPKVVRLNEMLEDYAKKNNIPFVDYYSSMVDDKLGLRKEYSDDGVHPNLAGYRVMEKILEEKIAKLK